MSLLNAAQEVREAAYVPYSKFKVGAAIRGASGRIYRGCNVENVAYPEGTCAEAGAISAMVAAGETQLVEVAVIADAPAPCPPCGGCRQKLAEFGRADTPVIMGTVDGARQTTTIGDLLPGRFDAGHMTRAG
ncbi:MAG: cytidine deaminase [Paracoccus sp. (in: a-proteobacteria)]|uniref:cytidine deaminase n=1 Tax=Paracoccus sp. TaxID=267 RepID=UPI004057D838